MAEKIFKLCHMVCQHVDPGVAKLRKVTADGLEGAMKTVDSVILLSLPDDDFLTFFDVVACMTALKGLNGYIAKATLLDKSLGCQISDIGLQECRASHKRAQAAINRAALLRVLARPHIDHRSKGKVLRNQLKQVWTTVESHQLSPLLSKSMQQRVEAVFTSDVANDAAATADAKDAVRG